jgi:hypothetical protein
MAVTVSTVGEMPIHRTAVKEPAASESGSNLALIE